MCGQSWPGSLFAVYIMMLNFEESPTIEGEGMEEGPRII